ncbi:MAG: HTH domain-containing protein [Candidatus Kapaibacterium sp.]|jgi:biotin operon repressor|nr:HTH domain-containing protein [Candidatus Kapabacteria bacterium]
MSISDAILDVMSKADKALSAGEITDLSGLDRKIVDKEIKKLKESGLIESPKRCYWQPKKQ